MPVQHKLYKFLENGELKYHPAHEMSLNDFLQMYASHSGSQSQVTRHFKRLLTDAGLSIMGERVHGACVS